MALQQALQEKTRIENRELAHRVAVRGVRAEDASGRAERLETLFERSPLPQLECDAAGNVVVANPAAGRLFGMPPALMCGQPLSVFVSHVAPAAAIDAHPRSLPVQAVVAGGTPLSCTASITPWAVPGGPRGFAVALSGLPANAPA